MWKALGRFMGAVVTGDTAAALDVLSEAPEQKPEEPHAEGDPPCGKVDGETRCMGHGVDGVCVMGSEAKPGGA